MKLLQLKYITEKGREVINECIELTKKDAAKLGKNSPKYKLFELYRFSDGIFEITNIDPAKMIIIKMFTKKSFHKMMKKDGCKKNIDYTLEVRDQ